MFELQQIHLDSIYWGNTVRAYLTGFAILAGVALAGHLIKSILLQQLKKWAAKSETSIDNFLVNSLNRTLIPLFYVIGLYAGISHLSFPAGMERAIEVITKIVVTYLIVRVIVTTISFLIASYIRKQERGEEKLRQTKGIMLIITVTIWIFGLVFLLANLGYDVTTIIAGLGIGGIAIALAAQTILTDLFSYFVIFFDRPFEIGDFIIVDDKMGTVNEIGIKTTRLNSLGGEELVFSNTDLTNSRLHNYRKMARRRVVFKVGVVYETSREQLAFISETLAAIVKKQKDVIFDRAHFFSYSNFSLDFEVCYYVMGGDYNKYMDIQQAINLEIFEEFTKNDIRFAYPTQTLLQPVVSKEAIIEEKTDPSGNDARGSDASGNAPSGTSKGPSDAPGEDPSGTPGKKN
ncbi:small-conductance mechanosensitive channel [Anseongella ginsenosidimutans]|uniref:Small-conductance mechanosensitive channel n=1 Tax=Anseongella ginsenosidimutans TaxID=496056 RepID=A0A4R3KS25_9SPHI|nr:mechanosensitive ion channel family protein [Anseongella ginsenosidimutans]QEC52924.1 mechanosensitive ion channel family protein [Anseongella ginsenosidimutans]TCS87317.1 small-conductance mechanosensitive channel [Anseongella ginsenosidimutans]